MEPFHYVRADDEARAIASGSDSGSAFIAGGTNVVDLMRIAVMRPRQIVDVTGLPLAQIEPDGDGLRLGALVRNSDAAWHPRVQKDYPLLAEALLSGASPQIRNLATIAGNLLQRTRCPYFRDVASACNKREPGSGCDAQAGFNRSHAVLGGSEHCIATNPSDMNVALVALDAIVHTRGPAGTRAIPIGELHTLPGDHPEIEHVLGPGELITHVTLPAPRFAAHAKYLKVRDRASFAFALASAAVGLVVDRGAIADARVALGGVATKPWRSPAAEKALIGQRPDAATFRAAAAAALDGAVPRTHNAFKIELARRTLVRALTIAAGGAS